MMATPSLLIIFSGTLRTTAFLPQQLPQIAGWLCQKTQADAKDRFFNLPLNQKLLSLFSWGLVFFFFCGCFVFGISQDCL
jgi:hypothetical protein